MAYSEKAPHKHVVITIIGLAIAVAFLVYVASVVRQGAGTTQSRASHDVFLTQGDDALSLQQDLNNLQTDPGSIDEQELNTLQ